MIFYIMGKSASGKDKIYKGLMKTFGARDNAGAKNAAVDSAPDTNEGTSVSNAPGTNEGTSVSSAPGTKESAEVNLHPIILYTTTPSAKQARSSRSAHTRPSRDRGLTRPSTTGSTRGK